MWSSEPAEQVSPAGHGHGTTPGPSSTVAGTLASGTLTRYGLRIRRIQSLAVLDHARSQQEAAVEVGGIAIQARSAGRPDRVAVAASTVRVGGSSRVPLERDAEVPTAVRGVVYATMTRDGLVLLDCAEAAEQLLSRRASHPDQHEDVGRVVGAYLVVRIELGACSGRYCRSLLCTRPRCPDVTALGGAPPVDRPSGWRRCENGRWCGTSHATGSGQQGWPEGGARYVNPCHVNLCLVSVLTRRTLPGKPRLPRVGRRTVYALGHVCASTIGLPLSAPERT